MNVKNKLTPYPILYDNNDNYINSSFCVEIDANCKFGEVYISVTFKLKNEGLQNLIDGNYACYTAHIECPSTSYRIKIESFDNNITLKIDSNYLKEKIEVCTFITCKEDIYNYKNENFHPDYYGYVFNLEKGNILALGVGKEFFIQKNNDDLESLPSIMKVYKKSDLKGGAISVDTDNSDYILVGVYEDIYDQYYSLGKNKFKNTLLSLILLPALIVVLTRMKEADEADDADEREKKWYTVIESLLNTNNILVKDLDISNKEKSILAISQMIFSDPISRSLNELESLVSRG